MNYSKQEFGIILCLSLFILCFANDENEEDAMVDFLSKNNYLQGKAEIVFLLDRSGSVGVADFEIEKGFVNSFLSHIVVDVNASRVAVISYSDVAVRHVDYLRDPKSKCFLSQQLQGIVYEDSGATNIVAALEEARDVFKNARQNVNKVVVLISDGLATRGGDPIHAAAKLKEEGVQIFCFGVGRYIRTELEMLASNLQNVFVCKGFKEFKRLARKIRGDPHELSWSSQATTPNCDHLCNSIYKGDPSDPGCCDPDARCSCALLSGVHTCVCKAGYYGLSGLAGDCKACPRGTFKSKLEPSKTCTPCPPGSTTADIASTKLSDCYCKKGYVGNPSKGIPCKVVDCPPLQYPANGYLLGQCDTSYGSTCHFMCKNGYELIDPLSDVRICRSNGEWSGTTAVCREVWCDPLYAPQYGYIKCEQYPLTVGKKCHFKCRTGYAIQGSNERTCNSSKKWTGIETKCIPLTCEIPPRLQFGEYENCKLSQKPIFRQTCFAKCRGGFKLEGPRYLTCRENGRLIDEQGRLSRPHCIDVVPPDIRCPNHIQIAAEKGKNTATIKWHDPLATDNSGFPPKLMVDPHNISSPGAFTIGDHHIRYIAIDHSGLKSNCTMIIRVLDKEKPVILRCPSDIEISTNDISAVVDWEEPIFKDNSGQPLRITKTKKSGDVFYQGTQTVYYDAIDATGNRATCEFQVKVSRSKCPFHPPPVNGALACEDLMNGQMCQAFCNEQYDFSRKPAAWYICNLKAQWETYPLNLPVPWPDCAKPVLPDAIRQVINFYYEGNCSDPIVQRRIKKLFLNHITQSEKYSSLCHKPGVCRISAIEVKCGKTEAMKRKKRNIWQYVEKENLEVEFEIMINTDQKFNDTEAVLQDFLKTIRDLKWDDEQNEELIFISTLPTAYQSTLPSAYQSTSPSAYQSTLPSAYQSTLPWAYQSTLPSAYQSTLPSAYQSTLPPRTKGRKVPENLVVIEEKTILVCKDGSVQIDDLCVLCPPGSFYDSSVQECVDCPAGYYQEYEGQLHCKECPEQTTTEHARTKNGSLCKGICTPGTYSVTGLETCISCPIGKYQHSAGMDACYDCPNGTTTENVGAISIKDCRDSCSPGSFSQNGLEPCQLCPLHFYQPLYGQTECLECPDQLSTNTIGTTNLHECIDIDPCLVNSACLNNGTCSRDGRNAKCKCAEGFTGAHCEEDIDECISMPCTNGGECINTDGSFYCKCLDGFSGSLCDAEIDECASAPCQNNATCIDEINGYTCVCSNQYQGSNCETESQLCFDDVVCSSTGACMFNDTGKFSFCACEPGFTGIDCSHKINECENITCKNGGSCIDGINAFTCACPLGFIGVYCETNIDECENNNCKSGSTCEDLLGGYKCLCPPGWNGTYCENKMDSDFILMFPESTATIANMASLKMNSPLTDATISLWIQTNDTEHSGTPLSYAVASTTTTGGDGTVIDNALTISDCSDLKIYVNNEPVTTDLQLADGEWHHLAFTWSSENSGSWALYKDGELKQEGKDLQPHKVIEGGGNMIIGQEQDAVGGGFSPLETFRGNITRVNIWNKYFSKTNITRLCTMDDDMPDKVIAWPDFLQGLQGSINILRNSKPPVRIT